MYGPGFYSIIVKSKWFQVLVININILLIATLVALWQVVCEAASETWFRL